MRYNKFDIINKNRRNYYKAKKYPYIPPSEDDIYLITTAGDRLDLLAYAYYKDASLWWVIAMMNADAVKGSMFPSPGTQLRISTNINDVLNKFEELNNE